MRSTEWMEAARKKFGTADSTFQRLRREALSAEVVVKKDDKYELNRVEKPEPENKSE